MRSTTHLHLVLRLRLSGAVSLLLLHAFLVWRRITLPFNPLQSFLNTEMSTAEWDCCLSPRCKQSRPLCSVLYHVSMGWHAIHGTTASGTMQKYSKERVPLSDGQERQRTYNATLMHVHVPTVIMEKQQSVIYSKCVSVALVTWHAKCMCCTVLSSVSCLAIHFLTYLTNCTIFGKELLNILMYVLNFLYNSCPKHS
jgi:hypothetical protein